ncbi:MAG: tRNA preQ1(34) S-adenosylmethionine ribosyltransferase-isomerase QueA, partial [Candidatus Eremiobacteraeota bacterium]|nr:tRNA preQ1(34) S-adenosylmethionine ribosyltransferase-isomerase QueA [Candidatus Eremiobacteraeota bacterium]
DYDLPAELIAQAPASPRDASRLMVVAGTRIEHLTFNDLPQLLGSGDLLVLNETKVIAARLVGRRARGGGMAELLLLHPADSLQYEPDARRWIAMSRPARRLHAGDRVGFDDLGEARIVRDMDEGLREIELQLTLPFEEFLARAGRMPLPPYIRIAPDDAERRYQTVFARVAGSVAAPTASLHFTHELLLELQRRGVEIARIALDVGLGTFRPVSAERIDDHAMHAEGYEISLRAADALRVARRERRRIVAAGTTVVRALEGNVATYGEITPGWHATELFIRPGFAFRVVDALLTNFHLPRSTLLMLVSAFGGIERIRGAYEEAIANRYRFYSFGDAMLIWPPQ